MATTYRVPVAHRHLFNVVATLLSEQPWPNPSRPLRLLDIGCGDGRMMYAFHMLARQTWPDREVEIHGFDIGENGFADSAQRLENLEFLSANAPEVDWSTRVLMFSEECEWEYDPQSFDVVVSNTVLEHVESLSSFFANVRRVLHPSGFSVHLFPLRDCIQEGHCYVPFAHWFRDFENRVAWIALLTRFGFGRYRRDRRILNHRSIREHAEETARYLECWTRYRSFAAVADEASRHRMSTSYHFTRDLFLTKLRTVAGRPAIRHYRRWSVLGLEWLIFMIGRSLAAVTLVIRPVQYDIAARLAAEKANRPDKQGTRQPEPVQ